MWTDEDIQALGQLPDAETTVLPLAAGDSGPESLWLNLINTRLQVDENYHFWKTRGGSELLDSFTGNILTIFPFAATIATTQHKYIAVHTDAGHAYLYDIDADTDVQMFASTFRTDGQVEFIQDGEFLYIFDGEDRVYKMYDIDNDSGHDWNPAIGKSIESADWITGDWTEENMWGLEEGSRILVLHTFSTGSYIDPEINKKTFQGFVTRVDAVFPNHFTYRAPDGTSYTSSSFSGEISFSHAGADIVEFYDGSASKFKVTETGQIVTNTEYIDPLIHKSYILVDQLADGSFLIPGRPITVSTTMAGLNSNQRLGIDLTVPAAADGVSKRYLYATRWQATQGKAYTPSRPEYPNSPYFLVKTVDHSQTTISDTTPDSQLIIGLAERLPLIAGVNQLFAAGQVEPYTVTSLKSSLLIGGYTITRPVPDIYTDAANAGEGNGYYHQEGSGSNLTNSPELAVQFEYTDGRNSNIVDTGQVLTDAEETIVSSESAVAATVEFKATAPVTGTGQVEVRLESDTGNPVTVNYLSTDAVHDVISKIVTGVNGGTIAGDLTASQAGSGDVLRFTWDTPGDGGNSEEIRLTWSATIDFEENGSGQLTKPFTGGSEGTDAVVRSGNRLEFHSMNSLVSSIHVLVKVSANYFLFETIGIGNGKAHGQTIYLPNSDSQVSALESYTSPSQILESVDLPGNILPAIPLQECRVNEQKRVEGAVRIGRLIPWQFDSDKNQIRYRVMAFTDRDIQMGYLDFGSGGAFSFDANFETVLAGRSASSFQAIQRIGGSVFFPTDRGMMVTSGREATMVFNNDRYQVSIDHQPVDVLHNEEHGEVWVIYPDARVVVLDTDSGLTRRMDYSEVGALGAGGWLDGVLYIGITTGLYRTDGSDLTQDGANDITALATTRHLGNMRTQARLLEMIVTGNAGTVEMDIDLQPSRREDDATAWSKDFNSDLNFTAEDIDVHGTSFYVHRRAIMPRIRLSFVSGVVEDIAMRQVITANKGKARQ